MEQLGEVSTGDDTYDSRSEKRDGGESGGLTRDQRHASYRSHGHRRRPDNAASEVDPGGQKSSDADAGDETSAQRTKESSGGVQTDEPKWAKFKHDCEEGALENEGCDYQPNRTPLSNDGKDGMKVAVQGCTYPTAAVRDRFPESGQADYGEDNERRGQ